MAAVVGIIEAIAGLFAAGAEAMSAGEAIVVLFLFIIELIMWFFMYLIELFLSLFQRRKPRKIKKPILWRKKKTTDGKIEKKP